MRQRRQPAPHLLQVLQVDRRQDDTRLGVRLGDDLAPGVHDHGVAVGGHAGGVAAGLVRGDDIEEPLNNSGIGMETFQMQLMGTS